MMQESLLNYDEVALRLGGISTKSVRRLIAKGELPPPVRVLSVPTIPESDVLKFIETQKSKRGGRPA